VDLDTEGIYQKNKGNLRRMEYGCARTAQNWSVMIRCVSGHKTEAIVRRCNIVDERDLIDAAKKIESVSLSYSLVKGVESGEQTNSRSGGTGRRSRRKICRGSPCGFVYIDPLETCRYVEETAIFAAF
jgi:hypothetical protein